MKVSIFLQNILLKNWGKNSKTTDQLQSGAEVITEFLKTAGIDTNGMFIEDGSGLSPLNAINTRELVHLLVYMKNKGKYFTRIYFFAS